MGYSTMCCEAEGKREEVTCADSETPLAIIMKETDGELYEARMTLSSIIVRLINAPKPEENREIVNSFTEQTVSVNRQAYDCRCLAKRIEQLLFGSDTISQGR